MIFQFNDEDERVVYDEFGKLLDGFGKSFFDAKGRAFINTNNHARPLTSNFKTL